MPEDKKDGGEKTGNTGTRSLVEFDGHFGGIRNTDGTAWAQDGDGSNSSTGNSGTRGGVKK